jgi:hypothetical protein
MTKTKPLTSIQFLSIVLRIHGLGKPEGDISIPAETNKEQIHFMRGIQLAFCHF